jgi:hypothetical protein
MGAIMRIWFALLGVALLMACKHPLAVKGQGDIFEVRSGIRGCTFEQSEANDPRCTENAVIGQDYAVSYEPVPRDGWAFVRWEGTACAQQSLLPYCEYDVPSIWVNAFNQAIEDLGFPATVAVFEPEGQVTLSTNIALPMQAITISSANLQVSDVAEVEFLPLDGGESISAFAPVLEESQVTVAVPPLFDELGNISAGAVNVSVGGTTATATLFIQPMLEMTADTQGLVWLANAYDTLEATLKAQSDLQMLEEVLGDDLSELSDLLAAEITSLEATISQFETTGVIQLDNGDGTVSELSGDDLSMLDNLILHRLLALAQFSDTLDNLVPAGAAGTSLAEGSVGVQYAENSNVIPRVRAAWAEAMEALEGASERNGSRFDGAAEIRESIASWEDAMEEASDNAARGVREFGTWLTVTITVSGNKTGSALKVAKKEAELAFSALFGKLNELIAQSSQPSSNNREAFDWSLAAAKELDKVVSLANTVFGGRTSTLRKARGHMKTLVGIYEAIEFRVCGDPVDSEGILLRSGARAPGLGQTQFVQPGNFSEFCPSPLPLTGDALLESLGINLAQGMAPVEGEEAYRVTKCEVTPEVNRNPIYILVEDRTECSDPWGPYGGRKSGVGEYCAWCPSGTYWRSGIGCCYDE